MFAGYVIDTNIHAAYLLQGYEADPLTKKYLAFYSKIPLSQRLVPDFIMNEFELFITQVGVVTTLLSPDSTSYHNPLIHV